MKKSCIKIISLILMLLMLVSVFSFKSYGINVDQKGTIKVTPIEKGVDATVYRLTKVNYDFVDDGPLQPPYEWLDSVKTYLEQTADQDPDYSEFVDVEKFAKAVEGGQLDAKEFYDHIAAGIRGNLIDLEDVKQTKTSEGEMQPIVFDNLDMGTYIVLIENGLKIYEASVVNLTPVYEGDAWIIKEQEVVIKSSEPTVTKTVDKTTGSFTDKFTFTIEADVPKYPDNALAKDYYLSDKLSEGLKLVEGSLKVQGIKESQELPSVPTSPTDLTDPENYTKTTGSRPGDKSSEETTFTLKFVYDSIKEYDKIKVTYEVEFDPENATLGTTGNKNNASMDYSNNPYDEATWNTKEDTETVYSYQAEITKVDKDETSQTLPGAEFELYGEVGLETKIKLVDEGEGVYHVAQEGEDTTVERVVSNSEGKITIKGLDSKTYYLKEVKAPAEYNLLRDAIELNVNNNNVTLQVENSKGFQLPVTGGIGTIIFSVIGGILLITGITIFVIALKKKPHDEKM